MRRIARLSMLGVSLASAACLTLGMGVASADTITNTGPGSYNAILAKSSFSKTVRNVNNVTLNNQNFQTAITGSASVSGNNSNGNNKCKKNHSISYKPAHKMMKTYSMIPSHYVQPPENNNQYSNNQPSYGGGNGGYGNSSSSGQGGSATTGNASNYNATNANVDITNNVPAASSMSANMSGNSAISNTGPHSFNLISSKSSSNVQVNNTNNVMINNTSVQTAVSGSANVSGNTRGGSAMTGNATNTNSTDIEVAITNN